MNFYTLDYIVSHQSLDATRRLAAIIVLLVVALAFSALYLHNRVKTRWRDAGIGLFAFSLVLLGIQTEQYLKVAISSRRRSCSWASWRVLPSIMASRRVRSW